MAFRGLVSLSHGAGAFGAVLAAWLAVPSAYSQSLAAEAISFNIPCRDTAVVLDRLRRPVGPPAHLRAGGGRGTDGSHAARPSLATRGPATADRGQRPAGPADRREGDRARTGRHARPIGSRPVVRRLCRGTLTRAAPRSPWLRPRRPETGCKRRARSSSPDRTYAVRRRSDRVRTSSIAARSSATDTARVAQLLQSLPGNFGGTATEQTSLSFVDRTASNATLSTGINLRGLGAAATSGPHQRASHGRCRQPRRFRRRLEHSDERRRARRSADGRRVGHLRLRRRRRRRQHRHEGSLRRVRNRWALRHRDARWDARASGVPDCGQGMGKRQRPALLRIL
jgi:hypothetical protein